MTPIGVDLEIRSDGPAGTSICVVSPSTCREVGGLE